MISNTARFLDKFFDTKFVFYLEYKFLSEMFISLRRIQRNYMENVRRSSRKLSAVLVKF